MDVLLQGLEILLTRIRLLRRLPRLSRSLAQYMDVLLPRTSSYSNSSSTSFTLSDNGEHSLPAVGASLESCLLTNAVGKYPSKIVYSPVLLPRTRDFSLLNFVFLTSLTRSGTYVTKNTVSRQNPGQGYQVKFPDISNMASKESRLFAIYAASRISVPIPVELYLLQTLPSNYVSNDARPARYGGQRELPSLHPMGISRGNRKPSNPYVGPGHEVFGCQF